MKLKWKYIAIDFDNTITDSYDFPGSKLREHAVRVIQKIKKYGGVITIWTCRGDSQEYEVRAFLNKHNIPYDYYNEHGKHAIEKWGYADSPKIWAEKYIDDASIHCSTINWLEIEKLLFIDDENWKPGDTIECLEDYAMNAFMKGQQFKINTILDDEISFGPVSTSLDIAKNYFKKVQDR